MKNLSTLLLVVLTATFAAAQPCTDIFFSEYVEGSSNSKALEIYNPTNSAIDLNDYTFQLYALSGSGNFSPPFVHRFNAIIQPGGVFVVGNPNATVAGITSVADTLAELTNYNGNDALVILNMNGDTVDAIGEWGVNPGASNNWPVGAGATNEFTLVRKVGVQGGTPDWSVGATQWDVEPQNTFSFLGSHSMTPCGPIVDTLVRFAPISKSIAEEGGSVNIDMNVNVPGLMANFSVEVVLLSGDTSTIDGFTGGTAVFFGTNMMSLTIPIVDDTLNEPAESFTFVLRNIQGAPNYIIGADSIFTLTVNASDAPVVAAPAYSIGTVLGNSVECYADSLGVECTVRGTVISPNYRVGTPLDFYINDGTGGLGVFSPSDNFGYTVNEGDSIEITGTIGQFSGKSQIGFITAINVLGTGSVPAPLVVQDLDESTEATLVTMENLTFVSSTGTTDFTWKVRNQGGDEYELFFDKDLFPVEPPQPSTLFTATGVGAQFYFSIMADPAMDPDPCDRFYQIYVRQTSDISVGIEESVLSSINVFPNPTASALSISSPIAIDAITVFDLAGKEMSGMSWNVNGTSATADVSTLNRGRYFVQFEVEGTKVVRSFTVIR